jgi:cell division protease FtsH
MDPDEKVVTAYHEAGHALVACLLPEVEPLHKVTIIPRGAALGATMQLPEKDKYVHRRKELLGELALLFGGRVAEELCCHDVSSGAQNDIKRATELARLMVTEWGMSDAIGPINYSESEETLFLGREITRTRSHSEATAVEIDNEVRKFLQDAYDRTRELLTTHQDELERLKDALVAHEVLNRKEVEAIREGRDVREIRKAGESSSQEKASPRAKSAEAENEEYGEGSEDLSAEGGFAF